MPTLPESARVFLLSLASTFVTNGVGFCSFQLFQRQINKKKRGDPPKMTRVGKRNIFLFVLLLLLLLFFELGLTCFPAAHIALHTK